MYGCHWTNERFDRGLKSSLHWGISYLHAKQRFSVPKYRLIRYPRGNYRHIVSGAEYQSNWKIHQGWHCKVCLGNSLWCQHCVWALCLPGIGLLIACYAQRKDHIPKLKQNGLLIELHFQRHHLVLWQQHNRHLSTEQRQIRWRARIIQRWRFSII